MASELSESHNELIKLANEVLKKYNIIPQSISVIQSGTIKTVWKVQTREGYFCLKRLKQTLDKALFSVYAQIHIKNSGGNVPTVIPDINGEYIVQHNEQLFILYEWLEGKDLDFTNQTNLRMAIHGLARFHITSKGYNPVHNARVSSKLGKWPEQYGSMKNKLENWREISRSNMTASCHAAYLKYADSIIKLADSALKLLESSSYTALTLPGSASTVLCHQDYGKGNAVLTDKGVFVLDLDGVSFDLPARDLRKIIGKQAENKGQWETGTIEKIIEWYTLVNPMTRNEKKVLYIDLLYPHWFFGLVKNLFQNNKIIKSSEIEKIAKLELSKVALLEALIKRGE